jgi:hypothetical protein
VLGSAAGGPAAVPGVPAGVTQPSAPQDFGKLTPRDFAGLQLGLRSQVLGILGSAGPSPGPAAGPADARPAGQPEGQQR